MGEELCAGAVVALIAGILLYYIFKIQLSVLLPSGILSTFGL